MGGFQINELMDPTLDNDAATKNYVDNEVGAINTLAEGTIYVGDTDDVAQEVAIGGDAQMDNAGVLTIQPDAITTVKIEDGAITDSKLDKTNIPLSGFDAAATNVSMGGFQINELMDPTLDNDAATKNYVDNEVGAINTLAEGTIYVGDTDDVAQEVTIGGDALMDNTGVLTIQPDAITTEKIEDGAITDNKLDKANIPLSGFDAAANDVDLGSNKLIKVQEPTD